MSLFIRRFEFDPGIEVFLEIEAVNILDLEPPSSITGIGTGTALLVGEFEDGPYNEPYEVTSSVDLAKQAGGFGYVYAGITGNYPCARSRKADGTIKPEYWNGNGMIALNAKKFRRLLICRVDTSVGAENFNRLAWLRNHSGVFSYALTPGGTFIYGHGTASFTTTFTAAAAQLTSGIGVYPSTFTGGETMTIKVDGGPSVVVVFQAADQTQAQVIARINAALGYTAAVDIGGGVTTLDGLVKGTGGSIQIVALSGLVATATGFAASIASGTGNVFDILKVTPAEIDAAVLATTAGAFRVVQLDDGSLRLENRTTPLTGMARVTGGTMMTQLGFQVAQNAAWQDVPEPITILSIDAAVATATGFAATTPGDTPSVILSSAGVYPSGFVGGEDMVIQVGSGSPKTVVFQAGDQTQAQVLARIDKVLGYNATEAQSATVTALAGLGTNDTTIPAGTLVQTTGGDFWLTTQTTEVSAQNAGPYALRVRPAVDDGTALGAAVNTVTQLTQPVASSAWQVTNPLALSAALSEAAIDVAYATALTATLNPTSVAREANLVYAARQSNAVRGNLRQNAIDASSSGLFGRFAAIRPPLGTTRAAARSNAAQPGVGAYRNQRVAYCYPGVQTLVPAIAQKGAVGPGYTADGIIDIGSDGFLISICSQLPPEENPGQLTTFALGALGVEKNNPDVQNLTIVDYTLFRASGICAPRMDGGVMTFQSGVTSVDPSQQPGLRNIARRRMADFIQDSLALALKPFGKKTNTRQRRALIAGQINDFMQRLLSPGNQAAQRIDGYKFDPVTPNTAETLALGIYRMILNVRTLSSLDAIVLQTTVGETVDVSEAA